MGEQILSLYAKGMSTRDIVDAFQEMPGAEVSVGLISKVTNAVIPLCQASCRLYFSFRGRIK